MAEPLEALVFDAVLAAVDGGAPDTVLRADLDDDATARRTNLLAVLAEAETKLAGATERFLEGEVSRAAYLRVKAWHEGVAAGARRELAAIERNSRPEDIPRNTKTLREWWPEATLLQRRTFLKLFIERVHVLPAPHRGARFSHERVGLFWIR
ncbi:hypothetical protein Gobs01_03620 [Geodermatophilus obscurus DSM 43160]|nr:hypothetical protein [Geodermatophilus obscurus]